MQKRKLRIETRDTIVSDEVVTEWFGNSVGRHRLGTGGL